MNKRFLSDTLQVGGVTLISRVFGFARDLLIAKVLGAGRIADAFFVAFKIPNLFRAMFAEGAFNSVFVPGFTHELKKNNASAGAYAKNIFAFLFYFLLAFTVLAEVFMPYLVGTFAPGFSADAEKFALATDLARIIFPFLMLVAITSFFGSILNSIGLFAPYAATPIILNICMITAAIMAAAEGAMAAKWIAWGVSISGVIQLVMLWSIAARHGFGGISLRPRITDGARRFFSNIGPGIVSAGVYHIQILVGSIFAAAENGATSWIYYADRLVQLPLGVIGAAVATVLLPSMARHEEERSTSLFNSSLVFTAALILPATVLLYLLASPIVGIFFESGEFKASDTLATARALQILAIGLPALVASRLFVNIFYARQDTRTPMRIACIALAAHFAATWVLSKEFGYLGIAAAVSISNWLTLAGLWFASWRKKLMRIRLASLGRMAGIATVAAGLGYVLYRNMPSFHKGFWPDFGALAVIGLAYAALYAALAWAFVEKEKC
ncbi:MAG: murein biosynthesis integral membrane protein MurJ [Rickettsiales bacterium]|nr:murein biosynthesis integral membrane protein MurJ [Rickettsiales bacterium]